MHPGLLFKVAPHSSSFHSHSLTVSTRNNPPTGRLLSLRTYPFYSIPLLCCSPFLFIFFVYVC
ncbi:hypothetical protein K457DRAFT_728747 [Linnemannia elongata AG-77]|uniref:Uncharacterized protein n=1 Tax=Linnemannia elongata AG-77 TaxID=1314771 RepID=A0A197JLI5_9FUNG|nr:hypothetical protein K457DRAFT_728747 [Linnemannia elongata AG-77]